MLFFLWRRVVFCGFGEAPKILEKSTSKLPKSSPKPSQIHRKTDQNPPKNALKTRSGGDCASDRFCVSFFLGSGGVLGAFARLWGPTWSRLGASGGVLEPSWHGLAAVLGRPWGVLGCLGVSLGRLGGVLGHLGSVSREIPRKTSIFYRFSLPTSTYRFSMPFWVDLGPGFPPNLHPKIDQNPRKIDAKMPSILDSVF